MHFTSRLTDLNTQGRHSSSLGQELTEWLASRKLRWQRVQPWVTKSKQLGKQQQGPHDEATANKKAHTQREKSGPSELWERYLKGGPGGLLCILRHLLAPCLPQS